ncbi:rhomboid family-domain-containing protein [Paraphysoderma sedebokerense]|nr:rhomboid family-domain-containing protein [Paraphysoderma sedebokerense]
MGSLALGWVYMMSGVAGVIYSSVTNPKQVSTGSSGALYGLLGLLYVDLFQNWPLLVNPKVQFLKLSVKMITALAVGLLPLVDNFSHIAGFVTGIIVGLTLRPGVYFSAADRRRTWLIRMIMIPLTAVIFAVGFGIFFTNPQFKCDWCQWLDCVPPGSPWCKL